MYLHKAPAGKSSACHCWFAEDVLWFGKIKIFIVLDRAKKTFKNLRIVLFNFITLLGGIASCQGCRPLNMKVPLVH